MKGAAELFYMKIESFYYKMVQQFFNLVILLHVGFIMCYTASPQGSLTLCRVESTLSFSSNSRMRCDAASRSPSTLDNCVASNQLSKTASSVKISGSR